MFNEDTEFPARQDYIFRQCGYDDHQRGRDSPLVNAGVDCIRSFVLDVCLGVVRCMLNYIKKGPNAKISNVLVACQVDLHDNQEVFKN